MYEMKTKKISPKEVLVEKLQQFLCACGEREKILHDIPSKWEKHGDLVLLPAESFRQDFWLQFGDKLWDIVAIALQAERVARKHRIRNDKFRSPQVELLKGNSSWVTHVDNKIKYRFDVTKCMFSAGNISEKMRIAKFSCEGETVVDLYAGIGYFTLPFLIHAKANLVHACEWNPHAVEALKRNLILNGVSEKCIIHFGDNRETCPGEVADRVYLGLIPSSEVGWNTACRALKSTGGILHVHGNVTSNMLANSDQEKRAGSIKSEWQEWSRNVSIQIQNILCELKKSWNVKVFDINRIKSYAPHIDHLVVDIDCRPS